MHQVLNNFLSSTTIHGCSYVHSDHSILQRILWVLTDYSRDYHMSLDDSAVFSGLLDKNSLWRPDVAMAPFSVGISGSQNFFNMRSSNKVVRTGYVTSMDIQPIEVVATDSLMGLDVSQRKCRFAHENDEQVTQLFSFYSQSACQFECTIKYAREVCQCTPWNMPFPTEPAGTEHVICDLYGNFCFSQLLSNTQKMDDCNCAPDCNYIRFQINEKESFIEPSDFCTKENNVGLRILNEKVKWGYNAMIRKYRKFYQMVARNETKSGKDFIYDLCRQMMQNDIAIVKVRFEAPHYIRTVMDKRVTFGDKLSSLGGALSLFTGMSIISLFEVIFWFITFVNNYILAKLTRNVSRCA